MEAAYSYYNFRESIDRIDDILNGSEANYTETKSIPSRDKLTFDNGYYVHASALCVDIRRSSQLPFINSPTALAKIYRCYISEVVATIKGDSNVNEIYIEGDGIWAIFNTPSIDDIDEVFSSAARVASLIDILNNRLSHVDIKPITVGIGLTYGEALYIKAGYKGSGINEVVWLGQLVSEAHELCSYANKNGVNRTVVSSVFYDNLNDHNKGLLRRYYGRNIYHGGVVNTVMEEWLNS
jgi:class 3 adenylate cyclase